MKISKQEILKDRLGFTMFLSISLHAVILISTALEFPSRDVGLTAAPNSNQRNLKTAFSSPKLTPGPAVKNFRVKIETLPPPNERRPVLDSMIEELQTRIENHRKNKKQRPQRATVSTISAQKEQAIYLENWRKRIEKVGNLYYPKQARKGKVFGTLRILVAVRADGQVENTRILEKSGSKLLDDAAERIVFLAAPFDPLPEEISAETDILEIIRTWRFHEGTSLAAFK